MSTRDIIQAAAGGEAPFPDLFLYQWGGSSWGVIGNGTSSSKINPAQVGTESNWAQVSTSGFQSAAVKTNGTLWAWAQNNTGQTGDNTTVDKPSPIQIGALSNWAQICCAGNVGGFGGFNVAIKTNGTLWAWGRANDGALGDNTTVDKSSPVQIGALSDWAQVSAASQQGSAGGQCVAIKTNGTLWTWGLGSQGRLGDNQTGSRSSPVQVGALTDWAQASMGTFHCLARKTNGTIWAWGRNDTGELGDNSTINRSSPVQIGALSDWAQVSAGSNTGGSGDFSMAIKTNGTLWAWGNGADGRLGDNTTVSKSSPVQIGALSDWAQVIAGNSYCLAIKTDGTLWGWGLGTSGQIGDGRLLSRSSPVQIGTATNWAKASAGFGCSLAVTNTGVFYSWGAASMNGQLGSFSSPVQVGAKEWGAFCCGSGFALGIKEDRSLWAWGLGDSGQLGNNRVVDAVSTPNQIGANKNWETIAAGSSHSMAITQSGTLWGWGNGANGRLGDNTVESKSSPVQIGALSDWLKVSAGSDFCVAIKTNNTLWAWGNGADGRLGDNTTVSKSSPVQIGSLSDWSLVSTGTFSCVAVKTDGTLWSWGNNYLGQLGDNTDIFRSSPVQIGALTDWAQVSIGAVRTLVPGVAFLDIGHCLAVKTDGTLWAWGNGANGALGDNTTVSKSSPVQIGALSDWAQVRACGGASIAIKTDGTLWVWGLGSSGQLGDNTVVSKSSPVQIGALSTWEGSPITQLTFSSAAGALIP